MNKKFTVPKRELRENTLTHLLDSTHTICSPPAGLVSNDRSFLYKNLLSCPAMLFNSKFFHQSLEVKNSLIRLFAYSTMAHKTYKGHLLCAIPFPEPKPMLDHIRACHPELKVSFLQTKLPQAGSLKEPLPAGMVAQRFTL